jgi:hypothetical protein
MESVRAPSELMIADHSSVGCLVRGVASSLLQERVKDGYCKSNTISVLVCKTVTKTQASRTALVTTGWSDRDESRLARAAPAAHRAFLNSSPNEQHPAHPSQEFSGLCIV